MTTLTGPLSGYCPCGWLLPDQLQAYPLGSLPGTDEPLPRTLIALRCPQCARGHVFYEGSDENSLRAFIAAVVHAETGKGPSALYQALLNTLQQARRTALEQAGNPLTEEQEALFTAELDAAWSQLSDVERAQIERSLPPRPPQN
jgi:hypothetical protein